MSGSKYTSSNFDPASRLLKKRGQPGSKKNYFGPPLENKNPESFSSNGQGGDHVPQGAQLMKLSDDWTLIRTENGDFYGEYHGSELLEALYEGDEGILSYLSWADSFS